MPSGLLGKDVNLEESRAKRWQEVACLVTLLETLDSAFPKASTTRQLAGEDAEAQTGDANHPRSRYQEKQVLE